MHCGVGHCGHCQLGPTLICRDGPVYAYDTAAPWLRGAGAVSRTKPKLAVWKFASCDGCQLSLLDCEDELLALAGEVEIAVLPRGDERRRSKGRTTSRSSRARSRPPHDAERIQEVRRVSKALVTIGACATAGGIQALRNFADVRGVHVAVVYASPEYVSTLATSTPISAHVPRRLRAARLPDRQAPAARGGHRVPARPPARHPVDERLHRVQAPRHRLRHGRPRDARASARSRTPAAARSAPPTTAAATAASGRWRRRTPSR